MKLLWQWNYATSATRQLKFDFTIWADPPGAAVSVIIGSRMYLVGVRREGLPK